jgi:hypothetical protein
MSFLRESRGKGIVPQMAPAGKPTYSWRTVDGGRHTATAIKNSGKKVAREREKPFQKFFATLPSLCLSLCLP